MQGNKNIDLVPAEDMLLAKNINLYRGGRESRGGTSYVDTVALSARGMGIFDYQKRDGTRFIVRATSNGKIYKNESDEIQDATLSATSVTLFDVFNNILYIANGIDNPRTWNGSDATTTSIAAVPTDWTTTKPFVFIPHSRGASRRLWAISSDGTIIASAVATDTTTAADFTNANCIKLRAPINDGFGLVGAIEVGERIMVFSKTKAYIVDDNNTDTAYWGVYKAIWNNGVAHQRLIVPLPNGDVLCMAENMEVYSVSAAETYGDYKAASLTEKSQIYTWMQDNLKQSAIGDFHGIYNPVIRAAQFFVVKTGKSQVTSSLNFYVDSKVWSIHEGQQGKSGISASCAGLIRKSVGVWTIYTIDWNGRVWELETANKNDNAVGYYAGFETPHMTFENPVLRKIYKQVRIRYLPLGNYSMHCKTTIDGKHVLPMKDISMEGSGATLPANLPITLLPTELLKEAKFSIRTFGNTIKFEFYTDGANEKFFLCSAQVDYDNLGIKL